MELREMGMLCHRWFWMWTWRKCLALGNSRYNCSNIPRPVDTWPTPPTGPSVQPGSSREKKITRGILERGKEEGGKGSGMHTSVVRAPGSGSLAGLEFNPSSPAPALLEPSQI